MWKELYDSLDIYWDKTMPIANTSRMHYLTSMNEVASVSFLEGYKKASSSQINQLNIIGQISAMALHLPWWWQFFDQTPLPRYDMEVLCGSLWRHGKMWHVIWSMAPISCHTGHHYPCDDFLIARHTPLTTLTLLKHCYVGSFICLEKRIRRSIWHMYHIQVYSLSLSFGWFIQYA